MVVTKLILTILVTRRLSNTPRVRFITKVLTLNEYIIFYHQIYFMDVCIVNILLV